MAIDYTAHCRLPEDQTERRIEYLRRARPNWFGTVLAITDSLDLRPFGVEIAREFGIEARSKFVLFVLDKERLDAVRDAVEFVYQVFGTDYLVITWGNDSIRPPLQSYRPMPLD